MSFLKSLYAGACNLWDKLPTAAQWGVAGTVGTIATGVAASHGLSIEGVTPARVAGGFMLLAGLHHVDNFMPMSPDEAAKTPLADAIKAAPIEQPKA